MFQSFKVELGFGNLETCGTFETCALTLSFFR